MLVSYFDESGTHETSTSLAVGGFIAPEPQWRKFEKDWRRALREEGLSYTHMNELENLKGPFADWDRSRMQRFQRRLLDVIKDHATHGDAATMRSADYEKLVLADPDPELPKKVGTMYERCAAKSMELSYKWALDKYPKQRIHFVFEKGQRVGALTAWFDRERRQYPLLDPLEFADKKEILPLQAADIFAYEAWKHVQNQYVPSQPNRGTRKSLEALKRLIHIHLWEEDTLSKLVATVRNATEY